MSLDSPFNIPFILQATGGKVLSEVRDQFSGYSTDNRDPEIQGKIFIPLVGEAHDAHKYVVMAIKAGATGVLFHQWNPDWDSLKKQVSFIEVENTLTALQDLARDWRKELKAKVFGITGSNGKTTAKDFLIQILSEFGKTHGSRGSFNNHWGVPFTLLDTSFDTDYCVAEMGMNHSGELTVLNNIVQPNFVTVTNVGRAHMGHFENGVEGIFQAKKEIYDSAPPKTGFVFNVDNQWTRKMYSEYADHPSFTYSTKNFSADVYFKIKNKTERGFEIEGQIGGVLGKSDVHFWGEHNVENLAAAVSMAYMSGLSPEKLWSVLKKCHTGWGRNQWLKLSGGGDLLFDGYNANPDSFAELFKNLKSRWNENKNYMGIFGEMLELGSETEIEHEKLGALAATLEWKECLFIGPSKDSFLKGFESVKNQINPIILNTYEDSLDIDIPSMVNDHSQVIVKGSRGGALERAVERLKPVQFSSK